MRGTGDSARSVYGVIGALASGGAPCGPPHNIWLHCGVFMWLWPDRRKNPDQQDLG